MSDHIIEQFRKITQQIKELAAVYHSAASKAGISDNELWVWYTLLVEEGEYSQQDISDMWSLPKQTVNSVISNLAKKGFLLLEAVPGTRNRKIIRITEEGRAYGERIVMPIYQAEQRSLERMPEDDRKMCISLLNEYIRFLSDEFLEN